MFSCVLYRQWRAIPWTIVALQVAQRVLAQAGVETNGYSLAFVFTAPLIGMRRIGFFCFNSLFEHP